ncbi:MAG: hypothetical protein GOVbin8609_2 [Prokaryotic dsDNA virus sp.]|nr:MAG: hypothetical protein GOVbin8609_2 [Prokaryotic dsDNA virus sp.]|tara:strand:- start:8498 stop:9019 length:522 start_codon:yes stop_codon:yes gene_type:complete
MKNIIALSTSTIEQAPFAQLAEFYNEYARELGKKEIKKFRDKATGQKRVAEIQAEYFNKLEEQKASVAKRLAAETVAKSKAEKPAKAEKAGRKVKFEDSMVLKFIPSSYVPKENSINEFVLNLVSAYEDGVEYQEVVDRIEADFTRPNGTEVTRAFARVSVNWLINKDHIRIA